MEAATARLGRGKRRKEKKSYGSEERRLATLLLSPAMIVIALVAAYPIGYAVWLSLTEYSLREPGKWRFAGFDNYTEAFGSTEFWDAVKNTFIFTGLSVSLELVIGLGILKFGAKHRHNPIIRVIMWPGILVQKITTKQPSDDMIEVAIVSMEQALLADGETVPDGSADLDRRPMRLGSRPADDPIAQTDHPAATVPPAQTLPTDPPPGR